MENLTRLAAHRLNNWSTYSQTRGANILAVCSRSRDDCNFKPQVKDWWLFTCPFLRKRLTVGLCHMACSFSRPRSPEFFLLPASVTWLFARAGLDHLIVPRVHLAHVTWSLSRPSMCLVRHGGIGHLTFISPPDLFTYWHLVSLTATQPLGCPWVTWPRWRPLI